MDQLRYADEVRSFEEVPIDPAEVKPAEMKLARQLIDQASSETFDPTKYTDEVREKVLEFIERKVQGEEITVAPAEEPRTQIIDLMAALKASLESGEERKPARRAGKKRAGKKAPAKKASAAERKRAAGE